jgi:gluconate 5-dehydrogenase
MDPYRLDNEIAVVTGGGTGLGLGMATSMAAAGARVVLVGRRKEPLLEAARQIGEAASYRAFDVTDMDRATELIGDIEADVGPVSILVNNAGVHLKKPALDTTEDEFIQVMRTHVGGAMALTRAAARGMCERRHGSVLFVGSMASLFGIPQVMAYTAAKTAIVGLVRSLAVELGSHNVRVNALAPGWIESEMSRKALEGDPQRKEKILGRTPLARLGQPEDVGHTATFLCSPAAKFITGVVLPVDGGASIGF